VVSGINAVGFVIGFLKVAVYFSSFRKLVRIFNAFDSPPTDNLLITKLFYLLNSDIVGIES